MPPSRKISPTENWWDFGHLQQKKPGLPEVGLDSETHLSSLFT